MLENFFYPKSIAVVGASRKEGKVGHDILKNLIQYGFEGKVFPVNSKASKILELKTYPNIISIKEQIDLVIIVVPSSAILSVIVECGEKKVDSAIIISAGFKESGYQGSCLEKELIAKAEELNVRLLGPNCLGLINPSAKLNASFAAGMPVKGNIAFFSQSGALGTAVLDWAVGQGVGFSKFISLGNKADLSEVEILQALADDPETDVILGYLEGVKDGLEFMKVAKRAAKKKPVIITKSGGTSAGARAASSHTGTLAGSEKAFQAAFTQCGVIRAETIEKLFNLAIAFAHQPLPKGRNLAIVTNAGGPGIIATDACEKSTLNLASLGEKTINELRLQLPPTASVYNPVDILGDAMADRYQIALNMVINDANVDGILVILTPQAMTDIEKIAETIAEISSNNRKPIIASFMGYARVQSGIDILNKHFIPNYLYPEHAVYALEAMADYREWQNERPPIYKSFEVNHQKVKQILQKAKEEGQINLGEMKAREIISAYGFSIPKNGVAETSKEAVSLAKEFGYPVVLKIVSPDILHKSDIGGVKVGLENDDEVVRGFQEIISKVERFMPQAQILGIAVQEMVKGGKEVILGMSKDLQFGPLIMFGLGGIYVEVLKDVSFRTAPISVDESWAMIREIRSYQILKGVRGDSPVDFEAISESLLRLSQLVTDFPEIVEADINPLLVRSRDKGVVAIDARFTIRGE